MADKKRSVGVTIFSWVIIVGSIGNLLTLQNAKMLSPAFSFFLYMMILPASIVVGIYLLKLKKWARTAIIVISVIVGIETLATLPYVLNTSRGYFKEQYDIEVRPQIVQLLQENMQGIEPSEANVERAMDAAMAIGKFFMMLMTFFILVLNAGIVFFFTRAKVKGQFEQ
ncbi:MAG: hypothetical protein KJ995_01380 [Candidatus Omnitrophica bacterium]|nr:hypothetical protein [Candidatus Omnitrophota bacterium]MBU1128292.1 hypothetical protein [Candidatus Omnitrophota bacterium]MBU1656913.1 hypothetical protein [Candidatus Omnitrophota bacterium]MBU1784047.1 hypothetical protein [Candidatus Omnitrophota bacterium]MBU1851042.1 hypothetical protein [Candidatus Omnitrophota bacterium]